MHLLDLLAFLLPVAITAVALRLHGRQQPPRRAEVNSATPGARWNRDRGWFLPEQPPRPLLPTLRRAAHDPRVASAVPSDPLDALREAYLGDPTADTLDFILAVERVDTPVNPTPEGLTTEVRVEMEREYRSRGVAMPPLSVRMASARAVAKRRWPEHFPAQHHYVDPVGCTCPPEDLDSVTDGTGRYYRYCSGACRRHDPLTGPPGLS